MLDNILAVLIPAIVGFVVIAITAHEMLPLKTR
jgi:hypothetical protein